MVFNSLGSKLMSKTIERNSDQIELNLEHLPVGCYWIKLEGEELLKTLKVIKE